MTVIEHAPDAPSARSFRRLADCFLSSEAGDLPEPLSADALEALGDRMAGAAMGEAET